MQTDTSLLLRAPWGRAPRLNRQRQRERTVPGQTRSPRKYTTTALDCKLSIWQIRGTLRSVPDICSLSSTQAAAYIHAQYLYLHSMLSPLTSRRKTDGFSQQLPSLAETPASTFLGGTQGAGGVRASDHHPAWSEERQPGEIPASSSRSPAPMRKHSRLPTYYTSSPRLPQSGLPTASTAGGLCLSASSVVT